MKVKAQPQSAYAARITDTLYAVGSDTLRTLYRVHLARCFQLLTQHSRSWLHYKILCSKFNYLQITLKLGLNCDKDVLVKNNNFSQR